MLTDKQKEKIAIQPDILQRDKNINHEEGFFFITLYTRDEVPVLGTIEGRVGGTTETDRPHVRYTALGKKVMELWSSIPQYHPQVEIIAAEAMPEHFHGLLYLKPHGTEHLEQVVNGFMIACTHSYWDILGIAWRDIKKNLSKVKCAAALDWQDTGHTHSYHGTAVFTHGYNDVVPITQEEVQTKIKYIRTLAEKRLIRGINVPCFRINRGQRSSWSAETALAAIAQDSFFKINTEACQNAQEKVTNRLTDGLDWIGEKQVLLSKKKLPLICHRADIDSFEKQKDAVITAAQEGAVIVSAFISPKEREIRDLLFMEQLPVIEIIDNGFSQRYMPFGKAFYACAERKLVQITPWKYLFDREAKINREKCLVMNELCRTICQCNDDWWKK